MVHVIAEVDPEVVQIQTPSGLGSGVVFDAKGDIVTNAHVVGSASSLQVRRPTEGATLEPLSADPRLTTLRWSASPV